MLKLERVGGGIVSVAPEHITSYTKDSDQVVLYMSGGHVWWITPSAFRMNRTEIESGVRRRL